MQSLLILQLSFLCVSVIRFVFFFKQKTAYEMRISDWSSDVCSSDLLPQRGGERPRQAGAAARQNGRALGEGRPRWPRHRDEREPGGDTRTRQDLALGPQRALGRPAQGADGSAGDGVRRGRRRASDRKRVV